MIREENVITLSKEEIKAIENSNDIQYNVNLASHINRNARIAKALTDENDAYKKVAKRKEKELATNKTVTITHVPYDSFSKEQFVAVYGEEEYKRFCVTLERVTVKFNG